MRANVTCEPHDISACGVCLGTVEPYEPPEPTEGKVRKHDATDPYPLRVFLNDEWRAQRPEPVKLPYTGTDTAWRELNAKAPQNDHRIGGHRATRNGHLVTARKRVYRAKPQPKPKPYRTDAATEARKAANRALAERLGINLPE
jgi:hypothetical protein